MNKIAVLIPCYNEEQTIQKVVKDFKMALPEAKIYVYDNNSKDKTAEIAAAAGATVGYESKQGKGNVIRRMFREVEADCYLLVDGDDTYDPTKAREMVNLVLEKGVDMVIGDRLSSNYFIENKRPFHNFGNKLICGLINFMYRSNIKDVETGQRAFSKAFVKLFPVRWDGFQIEPEMISHALDKRFLIEEVKIDYKERPLGSISKLNTYRDGMKVVKSIFTLFSEYKPLKFFGSIAFLLLFIGLILFFPVFMVYLETLFVSRVPTVIVSVFFILASMLCFFTGLILEHMINSERKSYEIKRNMFYSQNTSNSN